MQRAAAVVEALRARGVTAELESSGAGEIEPVCQEDTDECHASNRRVEFIIVPAS
ncbi:MAG: outer membrane protein OmpA-like peptidoglycan-associated protein [Polyangiales bacterium]|jgi:outer membrane protein OmpA-like peptidoglycan-associated protein